MPLYDYRCQSCGRLTERFIRPGASTPPAVPCAHCGSAETSRAVSRFSFRASGEAKYSEAFREQTAPFLKSRPEVQDLLAGGGESEEAKLYKLTEQIGERVDSVIENKVLKNLDN